MPYFGATASSRLNVGRCHRQRRRIEGRQGLPDLRHELLKARRRDQDQHPGRRAAFILERVRYAARSLDRSAGPRYDFLCSELKSDLTFEDEERFVLAMMDVRRRSTARQHPRFAQHISAAGLFAGREHAIDIADRGKDRAFTRAELNDLCWC